MLMLLCAITAFAQSSVLLENVLGELKDGQYSWTSEKMTQTEGATKLRLTFLETSNNERPAGFPCVAIAEFYLYDKDGKKVTLAESNFSSNATQWGEGSIAMLCNDATNKLEGQGDNDWYWHSMWSSESAPYGYHYLEVDLAGIEADLSEYSFGWVTRRIQASPAKIVVSTGATTEEAAKNANTKMLPKVSKDIVSVYTIKSVRSKNYLRYSEESEIPVQNGELANESYWYFTEGTDGKVVVHNIASGKVLGADCKMSTEGEWNIYPAQYRPGVVFCSSNDITSNYKCIDDQSGSIGGWNHNTNDNEGTTWLVEEVAGVDVPMFSLQGKKIASIGDAVTELSEGWYILNNVGRSNYVSQEGNEWKMRATENVAAGNFATDKAGYLFKITKNGESYNIVSGNGKYFQLGRNSASTSTKPVNFKIGVISDNNFYIFDKDHGYAADGQQNDYNFVGYSESIPGEAGGNDSYRLLPVELSDVAEIEIWKTKLTEAIDNALILYNGIKDYIGEGVGKYTAPVELEKQFNTIVAFRDGITAETAIADVQANIAALEALIAGFILNMPEAGKYYTICNDNYYITSGVTDEGFIALSETKDASAIYYFDGEHLLAYTTGLYFGLNENDWAFEEVGSTDISKIEFVAAANGAAVKYNIKSGNRWLHRTDARINRCTNNTCGDAHNWTIEEVTFLPVTVEAIGYTTFYAPVQVTIPADVEVYTVTVEGELATLNEVTGGVIPANTGVILKNVGEFDFVINYTGTIEAIVDNALVGSVAKILVEKGENAYYTLGNQDITEDGEENPEIAFCNPTNGDDETTFYNAGHKAYLFVEGENQNLGIRFEFGNDDNTTAIEAVDTEAENVEIYDLTGRRVNEITKAGVYIVNGNKVLVK